MSEKRPGAWQVASTVRRAGNNGRSTSCGAGAVAASAGNHGQGVAVAAQLAGVPATIVMPSQAPLAKVSATKGYGARVILFGEVFDEAHAEAIRIAKEEGLTYVHPFDDPAIMAGGGGG